MNSKTSIPGHNRRKTSWGHKTKILSLRTVGWLLALARQQMSIRALALVYPPPMVTKNLDIKTLREKTLVADFVLVKSIRKFSKARGEMTSCLQFFNSAHRHLQAHSEKYIPKTPYWLLPSSRCVFDRTRESSNGQFKRQPLVTVLSSLRNKSTCCTMLCHIPCCVTFVLNSNQSRYVAHKINCSLDLRSTIL